MRLSTGCLQKPNREIMTTNKVRTQIIGAAGEALLGYKLLKHEIDSARMTTDAGVDLVMYVPGMESCGSATSPRNGRSDDQSGTQAGATLAQKL